MTLTLGEIARHIKAELYGAPEYEIHAINTLQKASTGEISFFSNRRYLTWLKSTTASAVILSKEDRELCPTATLVVDNPYLAYAFTARLLYPEPEHKPGISSSAHIDPSAKIHSTAFIGPHVTIGTDTIITENVFIGAGSVIGNNVIIGTNSKLYANVVMYDGVKTGERVILHSGVVIGADGFGIANNKGRWVKIPQIGSVVIGNDVEIGANTTVDRGALDNTIIDDGVKIDNQVQVGHNVHIEEHTAIAGCVAIAGSTRIGKRCIIGGACGISGHIEIADDVTLMGMTGVANSIKESGVYASVIPAMDVKLWRKNAVSFKQLHTFATRIRKIEDNNQ
ncbi:MAG: UDP-3-O-(3-hydroxymyristoyl)glucosamine N-acyltransferase [Gammaproteobacteria bacterium RIFCSPLOWO2_12_47_11]|nr:MAG: UDP-3-O-(3-hydroxymyristoyl)glucosamine N-acyltransferase [Gammaproteobacteria bacterium RIFCSPLOWO2_12_47_11]OGT84086.1 MAG: UDP-3-O-(3-hydroxymyristoyl)glucosamine N-acyltransferase [Gammaproteobacteria bacterium RIFCSPLOWO2_12_FULL_47_76]